MWVFLLLDTQTFLYKDKTKIHPLFLIRISFEEPRIFISDFSKIRFFNKKSYSWADFDQATVTVPVLTGEEFLPVSDCLTPRLEDESFQLFSLASSISICSCLHSLLQNGVFPLQIINHQMFIRI